MSTNYYARLKPSQFDKDCLKKLIDDDKYEALSLLYSKVYGSLEYDYADEMFNGGYLHLGKRSGGWKFLWNPNIFIKRNGHTEEIKHKDGTIEKSWRVDPSELIYFYPLTKEGIKAFIDRPDVEIYDEYGEEQNKEEFWDMALNWGYEKDDIGYDAGTYEKAYPKHYYKCDNELIRLLEREGYKFSSSTKSDFYNDNLRFSTSTEFC